MLALATGCTPDGGGSAPADACLAATDGPVATTGGDHGEAWQNPFADSFADETGVLDLNTPPPFDYDGPPPGLGIEPSQWEYDVTARVYYRSPTRTEMQDNGWSSGILLVVPADADLAALRRGDATVMLAVPLSEDVPRPQQSLAFVELELSRRATHGPLAFPTLKIDRAGRKSRVVKRPMLRFYTTSGLDWGDIDGIAVKAMASNDGATELNGAMTDRTFLLRGPYPIDGSVHRIDIVPPHGTAIWLLNTRFGDPSAAVRAAPGTSFASGGEGSERAFTTQAREPEHAVGFQCGDDLDNDVDGRADSCDFECVPHPEFGGLLHPHTALHEYSKDIGIIGDAVFCNGNPMTAVTMLATWGWVALNY